MSACTLGFNPSGNPDTFEDHDYDEHDDGGYDTTPTRNLSACTRGLGQPTIARHLDLAYEAGDALAQVASDMAAVGSLVRTLGETPLPWLAEPAQRLVSDEFEFDGEGQYVRHPSDDGMATLEVRFYARGHLVTEDVFALSSYVLRPQLTMTEDGEGWLIHHEGPGPLGELLGFGDDFPQPLEFSAFVSTGVLERYDTAVTSTLSLETGHSTVDYVFEIPRFDIDAETLRPEVVEAGATADDPVQSADLRHWSVTYNNRLFDSWLDGEIRLAIAGEDFNYRASYDWEMSERPQIHVECLP